MNVKKESRKERKDWKEQKLEDSEKWFANNEKDNRKMKKEMNCVKIKMEKQRCDESQKQNLSPEVKEIKNWINEDIRKNEQKSAMIVVERKGKRTNWNEISVEVNGRKLRLKERNERMKERREKEKKKR